MNNPISFPQGKQWNGSREIVEFEAESNGKKIHCAVSLEALCDNFDGDTKEPLQCFLNNRARIESLATKIILRQRFENDGSILVRNADY
jgi:hypothetical protein